MWLLFLRFSSDDVSLIDQPVRERLSLVPVLVSQPTRRIRVAGSVDAFKSVLKSFLFSEHYGM